MSQPRVVNTPTRSRAARRTAAPFGLLLDRAKPADPDPTGAGLRPADPHHEPIHAIASLHPGAIALITGPSGAGKSTLLAALQNRLRQTPSASVTLADAAAPLDRPRAAVIEHLASPDLARRLGVLTHAGLAEPALLVRPASTLSAGERARLTLARAMEASTRTPARAVWLLIDECGSLLDRRTAAAVAATLHRWARREGPRRNLRLIAATAHDDTARLLSPDLVVTLGDSPTVARRQGRPPRPIRLSIDRGSIADYDRLGRHHYRAGRPATWRTVLIANDRSRPSDPPLGVLVTSQPTLNGRWRQAAWPGRYASDNRARDLRRLNREVRCVSRVVVAPWARGLGVATELVRAYLDKPDTPATEAVAAMGALCPFFERAGMTPHPLDPRPADLRLIDALAETGLSDPADLIDLPKAHAAADDPFVRAELFRWARSTRSSLPKRLRGPTDPTTPPEGPPDPAPIARDLARLAAARLCCRPVAYAHAVGRGGRPVGQILTP